MTSMVRLIYASRLAEGVGPEDLQKILEVSRKNNEARGITGALCYDPQAFLQCLEGPRDAVNALYTTIVRDDRHRDVTLIEYADIYQRTFETWSMAFVRTDELDRQLVIKYSATRTFDPFSMSALQAGAFIADLAAERQAFLKRARGGK
jgi:hypothetical protein